MFDRNSRKEVTLEASREVAKPKTMLKPRKVRPASVLVNLITISVAGVFWRQEEEGRDLRGLSRLQQEDPAHGLAPPGEHHRGGRHQQPVPVPGELLHHLSFILTASSLNHSQSSSTSALTLLPELFSSLVSCCWWKHFQESLDDINYVSVEESLVIIKGHQQLLFIPGPGEI